MHAKSMSLFGQSMQSKAYEDIHPS